MRAPPPCSFPSPSDRVRESTGFVVSKAEQVSINESAVRHLASEWRAKGRDALFSSQIGWSGCGFHFSEDASSGGPLTAQYVFVLDCLNFCFWPTPGLEYEHLARGLKVALEADCTCLDGEKLCSVTEETIKGWMPGFAIPQLEERVALVRELGTFLVGEPYCGNAAAVVRSCDHSAAKLVATIVDNLPGFRDETSYRGRPVHLYKRAQILAADIWAAYGQRGKDHPFGFDDIDTLTMFADYRVPQSLLKAGVLVYSSELMATLVAMRELKAGCAEEVEIRAATVQAVEQLRQELAGAESELPLLAIEIDWLLWHEGELVRSDESYPFHRCMTRYY